MAAVSVATAAIADRLWIQHAALDRDSRYGTKLDRKAFRRSTEVPTASSRSSTLATLHAAWIAR